MPGGCFTRAVRVHTHTACAGAAAYKLGVMLGVFSIRQKIQNS